MIICAGIFAGITLLTGTGSGGNVFAQRVDENEATASGEARQDGSIQNDRVPDDGARNENVLGDGDQAEKSQEEQGEIFVKDVLEELTYMRVRLGRRYLGREAEYDIYGARTIVQPNE